MIAFIVTTILCFITYLLFTIGSGTDLWLWSYEEVIFGIILSAIVGILARKIFVKKDFRMAITSLPTSRIIRLIRSIIKHSLLQNVLLNILTTQL